MKTLEFNMASTAEVEAYTLLIYEATRLGLTFSLGVGPERTTLYITFTGGF